MATYRILSWHELPSQIHAEDAQEEVAIELPFAFQDSIDKTASERGLAGSEDYLNGWNWSEPEERPGTAREVADALVAELQAKLSSVP